MTAPARVAAWRALRLIHDDGLDLPAALARARDHLPDPRDRALATEISLGVLRWRAALDHLVARAANRPVEAMDAAVLDVLRVGAYQLTHLTRVPAAVVVNEAVAMTKDTRRARAAGFVNAALRRIAAGRAGRLPPPPRTEPPAAGAQRDRWRRDALAYLSVTLSHPRWLAERWLGRYGLQEAAALARFNNDAAPLTVRANRLRTDPRALAAALGAHGVTTTPGRFAPDALVVVDGQPQGTPPFRAGACVIQDEASQVVGDVAAAACRAPVLDACAAPGGKTLALAVSVGSAGQLVAADARWRRVRLLRETLRRVGASAVPVVQLDLVRGLPFRERFQGVLVDAPCSGLGTLRRDPDIRWKRDPRELPRFAAAQRAMLGEAARVVRPGGRLVYATCSSEPDENDAVVDAFLAAHPAFTRLDVRTLPIPASIRPLVDPEGLLRTLPQRHGLEAFFAAVLERR